MRVIVVVWFAVLAFAQAALAADLGPYLRGPQYEEPVPVYRWSGVYGGGQVGFSVSGVDFTGGVGSLVAHILRVTAIEQDQHISDWPLLGKRNPTGGSFGGFVGYNWQWEDAVAGIEVNYNRTSLNGVSGDSLERVFIDNAQAPPGHNFQYDVTVTGSARAHITAARRLGGGAVPAVRLRGGRCRAGRRGAHGDRSVHDHGFSQSGRTRPDHLSEPDVRTRHRVG